MKKIFFNSSLPRSGSTLISNLIAQNPEFYATPTSGLSDLVLSAKNSYAHSQAILSQDKEAMEKAFLGFCRAGMQGFFNNLTPKEFIVDKSRDWGIHYNLLNLLYPEPKIICMVRDVRAVYASMEKNFRKNPHKESHIQNAPQLIGTTLDKRINIWADGVPVGIALDRLKDVIQHWSLDYIYNFLDYLVEYKKFKYILICNCCNQTQDNADIHIGGWRQLSCDYFPLKKYNPIKLFNYHSKEVSIIEIK